MKKTTAFFLACLTVLSLLAGCGAKNDSASAAPSAQEAEAAPAADTSEFKTMGDVFSYDSGNNGFSETHFVYVFDKDGITYRATAELPADVSEAIWAIDFFDENRDAAIREMVASLPILQLDNLTEMLPPQEELDALIGKNVQELLDDGWTFWCWNTEDMEFGMNYGPFSYTLVCEGTLDDPEDFDESQADRLTVKSAACDGVGDAVEDMLEQLAPEGFDDGFEDAWDEGLNPIADYVGEYQCDRAHMLVEAFGSDGCSITVEWGDSAMSLVRWWIESYVDADTMIAQYSFAEKTYVTYGEDGETESEELLADECSGAFTFCEDGSIVWHDDQSEYGQDMVFERVD